MKHLQECIFVCEQIVSNMHIILTALNLSASFHRNVLYNHTYLELIKRSYDTDYIFHNHTSVYSELKITFSEKNLLQIVLHLVFLTITVHLYFCSGNIYNCITVD